MNRNKFRNFPSSPLNNQCLPRIHHTHTQTQKRGHHRPSPLPHENNLRTTTAEPGAAPGPNKEIAQPAGSNSPLSTRTEKNHPENPTVVSVLPCSSPRCCPPRRGHSNNDGPSPATANYKEDIATPHYNKLLSDFPLRSLPTLRPLFAWLAILPRLEKLSLEPIQLEVTWCNYIISEVCRNATRCISLPPPPPHPTPPIPPSPPHHRNIVASCSRVNSLTTFLRITTFVKRVAAFCIATSCVPPYDFLCTYSIEVHLFRDQKFARHSRIALTARKAGGTRDARRP